MISHLRGQILLRGEDAVVLDVNGVGYRVRVPTPTLATLEAGAHVELFTHLQVSEDDLSLFGFLTEDELKLFQQLKSVSGIGPKAALAIMSSAAPNAIRAAIAQNNLDVLTSIPGIGKKKAQQIVLDIKDKIRLDELELVEISPLDQEVIATLVALGYSAAEAQRAARVVPSSEKLLEDRVRAALRYLGS